MAETLQRTAIATTGVYKSFNSPAVQLKATIDISYGVDTTCRTSRNSTNKFIVSQMGSGHIFERELSMSIFYEHALKVNSITNDLKVFIQAFENQRKMYKYSIAWNNYQNDLVSDDEMDKIEEQLVVCINNDFSIEETHNMMISLFKHIKEDDFDCEELSSILGVPKEHVLRLLSNPKKRLS